MIHHLTVREYARLTTGAVPPGDTNAHQIAASAFDWLCHIGRSISPTGLRFTELEDQRWLRLANFVGVIETPCGTRIEILPKTFDQGGDEPCARALLWKMIYGAMHLPVREVGEASLERFKAPLTEWVITQFLSKLNHLLKKGLQFDYRRIEASEYYLRGRLDLNRQLRQPPGRQHIFQICEDVFLPDRPENRLLRLALDHVARSAQTPSNWRLAQELRSLLNEVPPSQNVASDFRAWSQDRLLAHYQPIKPWCEIVLNQQMPTSLVGQWRGISLLFPMEKLFERYVERWLREHLSRSAYLRSPAASQYLCDQGGKPIFQLQPDFLVELGEMKWILDAKWKQVDARAAGSNYELSQGDFYQLHAYGKKYLPSGEGVMALIYPANRNFKAPLPKFSYDANLDLLVLPFDLFQDKIAGIEALNLPLCPTIESVLDGVPAPEHATAH